MGARVAMINELASSNLEIELNSGQKVHTQKLVFAMGAMVSHGKDVVVDRKFIPKDKLKPGKQVSIVMESLTKK